MNILKNLLFFWDNRFQTEENQGIILSGAYKISYIQSWNRLTTRKIPITWNPSGADPYGTMHWTALPLSVITGLGKLDL